MHKNEEEEGGREGERNGERWEGGERDRKSKREERGGGGGGGWVESVRLLYC